MTTHPAAAYVQVTQELRDLVLAEPWQSSGVLPAEHVLVERFGVSRGTLRRATEELAREGLLLIERGRGTSIRRQAQLRAIMKDQLTAIALPDSRWHLDVLKFVPDFAGSELARERLFELPAYQAAETVFVAPDNSATGIIEHSLQQGQKVVVPTYALRRGMVLLDPATISSADFAFAATLDGLERFGETLTLESLKRLQHVDMLMTGAIAFTTSGVHVGNGQAYLDLEWGILATLGLVQSSTPIIGLAHDIQVVDIPLEPKPLDVTVNTITTPTKTLHTGSQPQRPSGISVKQLRQGQTDSVAYLSQLVIAPEGIVTT